MIHLEIPMALPSMANARGHTKHKHAKVASGQRRSTLLLLRQHRPPGLPVSVRLTRVAPRPLDSDNLQRSLKAVRDGVADWLGVDDGCDEVRWFYAQAVDGRPHYVAARIEIAHGHSDCDKCGSELMP